ncbi:MAG: hypothetical protein FJX61_04340 [Alphaproteobacteria bacterium]|nr:hypothetical protein [Alphaproteobacteria bacterium]
MTFGRSSAAVVIAAAAIAALASYGIVVLTAREAARVAALAPAPPSGVPKPPDSVRRLEEPETAALPSPPPTPVSTVTADDAPENWPDGKGRDETFYFCTACHGFRIVAQQGLSRERWSEALDWMVVQHKMPALAGAERETILDYLAQTFPSRARGRAAPNPFLKP